MEKKKEITLTIVGLCALLVLAFGGSYAYFVSRINQEGEGANVDVRTVTLGDTTVTTEGSIGFSDTDIYPGHKNISKIKVTATGDKNVQYNLTFTGPNELPLMYYVYKTTTNENPSITCTKKEENNGTQTILYEECTNNNFDNLGEIVSQGQLLGLLGESSIKLVKNEELQATASGATVYYYIVLEFYNNENFNQNISMNKTLNGVINVSLVENSNTTNSTYLVDTALGKLPINSSNATFDTTSEGIKPKIYDEYKESYSRAATPANGLTEGIGVYDLFDSAGNSYYQNNSNDLMSENMLASSIGDATWDADTNTCTYDGIEVKNMITREAITNQEDCKKVFSRGLGLRKSYYSFNHYVRVGEIVVEEQKGLYAAEDDEGTSYYYRGNVNNNWVKFGGFYWRIIRVNGDGSIRMIYNGTTTDQTGETTQIKLSNSDDSGMMKSSRAIGLGGMTSGSAFNSSRNDNAYVGYMYGTAGSSTYEATHANTNSSNIKQEVDKWYESNISGKDYEKYISTETGFCGDRSVDTISGYGNGLGYGINSTSYGANYRLSINKTPSLKCENTNDLYTVSSSNKGNKALTYPVGLIAADEVSYAGGLVGAINQSYYLYTGQNYWTISPSNLNVRNAGVFIVDGGGALNSNFVDLTGEVRPVINLKSDLTFTGDGTTSNPFTIVS